MLYMFLFLLIAACLFTLRHTLMVSIEDSVAGKSFKSGLVAFFILALDVAQMFLIMKAIMYAWGALT